MGHENTKRDAVAGLFDLELTRIRDRQAEIARELASLEAERSSLDREAERLTELGAKVEEALVIRRTSSKGGGE